MKKYISYIIFSIFVLIVVLFATKVLFFRIDLTQEKRYTISPSTKNILNNLTRPFFVNIYIGEADANIEHLKSEINDILEEFNAYSSKQISYVYINPSEAESNQQRVANFEALQKRGLTPITISRRDSKGKLLQDIIFPWAEVISENDTFPICIMPSTGMKTAEQSVNAAIEALEYNFADAINMLEKKSFDKIAFLEGHGELSEIELFSITEALGRYYQIYSGVIGGDANVLDNYRAIIIAKPTEKFSESDKFVLDQYIMNGGRVIWLLDATKISTEELSKKGVSPALPLDINLGDMLFRYGVRLETAIIQDLQCTQMPINVAMVGEPPIFENIPWLYSPLLMPYPNHSITKNLMNVKADFPSFITQVNAENGIKIAPLLLSSNATRIDMAPTNIDLRNTANTPTENFFNAAYAPVAVLLEGSFESAFVHRQIPDGVITKNRRKDRSEKSKMIVVADGDIIRNDIDRSNKQSIGVVPLGLDRITGQTYGNQSFIVNAIQYLTDDNSLIELRNREVKLRLLDKNKINSKRLFWQAVNTVLPIAILLIFGIIFVFVKRCRYINKKSA